MIRYVAIGAVVGFLLSVFLLSRTDAPPAASAPSDAPMVYEAPVLVREHRDLKIPVGGLSHRPPRLLQQLEALAVDAGHT